MKKTINLPDLGTDDLVDVIEINVSEGDAVGIDDTLLTLEGEKATMDIPATDAGVVKKWLVSVGDKVKTGTAVLEMELEAQESVSTPSANAQEPDASTQTQQIPEEAPIVATPQSVAITLPDLGTNDAVDVIEVSVSIGDKLNKDDTLLTLEGEKATMDIPAPHTGELTELSISVGDKVTSGQTIGQMMAEVAAVPATNQAKSPSPADVPQKKSQPVKREVAQHPTGLVFAGPGVRRMAREFGVDLAKVGGTGRKGRISREDVRLYIKGVMQGGSVGGSPLPSQPSVDFSKFGEVEMAPLSKIKKATAKNMHASWLIAPQVTHSDKADITELEAYRQANKGKAIEAGYRLTMLAFIIKVSAEALSEFKRFNASLSDDLSTLIVKKYINIGVAVDTPNGLVVPVIKDVPSLSIADIAVQLSSLSEKARDGKLSMKELQGASFTISSLGGIGGHHFTPIVNVPEVAILGVSKANIEPQYQKDGTWAPRLQLPLSLSYDHRVIDGAEAARFMKHLCVSLMNLETTLTPV